jgi:phosphatidate phosphatase APP1
LQALQANLRQFRTVEVPYAPVVVSIGDRTVRVRADREGYVDVVVAVDLTPGVSRWRSSRTSRGRSARWARSTCPTRGPAWAS